MPLTEIIDFNEIIDNKPFLYQPVKNKQEAYEKLIEMSEKGWLYNWQFIRLFASSELL